MSDTEHPMAGKRKTSRARQEEAVNNIRKAVQESGLLSKDENSPAQEKLKEFQEEKEESFSPSELKDLKDLISLGRSSSVVNFGGYKFEISTLTMNENRQLIQELAKRGENMVAYIKECTLAKAIRTVNSVDLIEIYDGEEDISDFEKRVSVVSNWQSSLVAALYDEYEKVSEKSEKIFNPEEINEETKEKLKK